MKVQKTYETLLKGDENQARRLFEELERNDFQGSIDDWDAFINLLHDKRLKSSSEVVALNYLSVNILEGSYQDSLSGSSDSKIILNLLNIMSFKLKSQTDDTKRILSIGYGSIYCYLCCKIFSHLQDFNDTHKKIKQRIEEDAKHLVKLLEFGFTEILPASRSSNSRDHLVEQFRTFIIELTRLLKKQPHIFKNQVKFIENIVFSSIEAKKTEGQTTPSLILEPKIQPEVITLLSHLPRCVNTVAAYPDKVKYFLNRYIDNFFYGFLFLCRGIDPIRIFSDYTFDETFKTTPSYIFDWQSLLNVHSSATNSSNKATIIRIACAQRLQLLTELIINTISNVKRESVHAWNLTRYFDIINTILSLDAKYIENSMTSVSGAAVRFDASVLETGKLSLPKEEYVQLSLQMKEFALNILETLVEVTGTGMLRHSEWLYNVLYYVTITYENSVTLMQVLLRTCTTIFMNTSSMFFEFGEYLLCQSPLAPLELLSESYSTKTPSKMAVELQKDILVCMNTFLVKCGRLQTKAELVGQLDAAMSKALQNPRMIAKGSFKEEFFDCLETTILSNTLKFEESLLLGEFSIFFDQYKLIEIQEEFVERAKKLQAIVYQIRQTKRITLIENSGDLHQHIQKQVDMINKNENADTQAEEDFENKKQTAISTYQPLEIEESWGNSIESDGGKYTLKRTFTDLINDQPESINQPSKKVLVVQQNSETVAVAKKLSSQDEGVDDEELVLNPVIDSD